MRSPSDLRKPGRTAYDDGRLRITCTGRRPVLTLAGVINEHTRTGLVSALSRLTAGRREIHISLRDVTTCELAGLRAIILLTGASSDDHAGPPSRLVVLRDVPPHLTSILRILGWDQTPGLVIAGSDRRRITAPRTGQAWPASGQQPAARPLRSPLRSPSGGQLQLALAPGVNGPPRDAITANCRVTRTGGKTGGKTGGRDFRRSSPARARSPSR